jgi:lysophospholipid acyltransferase (LPLAT)-like uncharacterized protein
MSPAAGKLPTVPKPATAQRITPFQTLTSFIAGALLKLLAWTLRVRHVDRAKFYDAARTQPIILCVWHNRLLGAILGDYRTGLRRMPTKVLTSASADGGWLAAMARRFNLGAVPRRCWNCRVRSRPATTS